MDNYPTTVFDAGEFSEGSLSIGSGLFQIVLFFSLAAALIFTIILLSHWKRYAPNKLKVLTYSMVYLVGLAIILLLQVIFLSIY